MSSAALRGYFLFQSYYLLSVQTINCSPSTESHLVFAARPSASEQTEGGTVWGRATIRWPAEGLNSEHINKDSASQKGSTQKKPQVDSVLLNGLLQKIAERSRALLPSGQTEQRKVRWLGGKSFWVTTGVVPVGLWKRKVSDGVRVAWGWW